MQQSIRGKKYENKVERKFVRKVMLKNVCNEIPTKCVQNN